MGAAPRRLLGAFLQQLAERLLEKPQGRGSEGLHVGKPLVRSRTELDGLFARS